MCGFTGAGIPARLPIRRVARQIVFVAGSAGVVPWPLVEWRVGELLGGDHVLVVGHVGPDLLHDLERVEHDRHVALAASLRDVG